MHARWLAASAALLLVAGCGDSHMPPDAEGVDAGATPDAGGALDAGGPRDGGGMDGTTAFDSGPILAPVDAGDPFGDAGPRGAPEWVDLDILVDESCPELTRCGGDVRGTWDVTGGCIEVPFPETLRACTPATVSGRGRTRGRVSFEGAADGGIATRTSQHEVQVDIYIPSSCASFVPGGCSAIEADIQAANPDSRCVEDARGDCICAVREVGGVDQEGPYAIEDDHIVSGERWEYCVDGDVLRNRDVSEGDERAPGIIELARR